MAVANVVAGSAKAAAMSHTLMQEMNMQTLRIVGYSQDAHLDHTPGYYLYVFNITPREFQIHRPPAFSTIIFRGCPEGQPYALVGKFPDIVDEKSVEADSGEIRTRGIKGERFVMDLINPANHGINMWQEITDQNVTWIDGGTNDYTRRGLFWTKNAKPGWTCLEHGGCGESQICPVCGRGALDEIYLAKLRLEKHYKQLIMQADQYSREGNPREIGPEHHMAGDYFHIRSPWHVVAELPSTCPNCGDAVKEGVPFHINSIGIICVMPDQESWKRAIQAGVKQKADVPDDFRWWKTPAEKRAETLAQKEETVEAE